MGVGQMGVGKWVPIPEEYSTTYSHNQKTDPESARVSHTNDTLPYSNTVQLQTFVVQKFRESLQIGIKVSFRDKNFVITLTFHDSMLTPPFFSKHALVAKIYSWTDIFSDPDFKDLSRLTTMPDHQSNKTCGRWDSFQYPRLLQYARMENNVRKYIVRITFFPPPPEWKDNFLAFHWHCIRAHTMLQQLQNQASNDIKHGFQQTYPLVESYSDAGMDVVC